MENTAINNQLDYLKLVKKYLLQIDKHVLRENRAKIIHGVSSVLTDESLKLEFRQAFAEFRAKNAKENGKYSDPFSQRQSRHRKTAAPYSNHLGEIEPGRLLANATGFNDTDENREEPRAIFASRAMADAP